MKRMSFSQTKAQMYDRSKTVTRRSQGTWKSLKVGDRLVAVEQAMGLPKGSNQVVISEIEIVSNSVEKLRHVNTPAEIRSEGFSTLEEFRDVWSTISGSFEPDKLVRRIEFRHVSSAEAKKSIFGDQPDQCEGQISMFDDEVST